MGGLFGGNSAPAAPRKVGAGGADVNTFHFTPSGPSQPAVRPATDANSQSLLGNATQKPGNGTPSFINEVLGQ